MAPQVEAVTEPLNPDDGGEAPHWDHTEPALYFVSFFSRAVNKYIPTTGELFRTKLYGMPSFVIPVEGKRNNFVLGIKRKVVEIEWTGEPDTAKVIRTVAEVEQDKPFNVFNDGKADPRGRLFAGTMGLKEDFSGLEMKKGSLYRFDPDGTTHKLAEHISLSNGMCWDLAQKVYYYMDSYEYTIRRYDYDIETGNISNMKSVFDFKENGLEGIGDGMTIDTDGNLWIANFEGQHVVNVDPKNSTLLHKIPMPAWQVTSLTFGGPLLDTLYVTSGSLKHGEEERPFGGPTYKITGLGVKGLRAAKVKLK